MDLKEWVVEYVKHKDLLKKELDGFEVKDDRIEFRFEDRKHDYFLKEKLDTSCINPDTSADLVSIACPLAEENLNFLVDNWEDLEDKEGLTFILVNLDSNDKLIIRPHTHSKIADPDSLEEGLRTMYEQVAT